MGEEELVREIGAEECGIVGVEVTRRPRSK
jgi:hypothetical protein